MGPIWGRKGPGGPHVGPMNFAIWVWLYSWTFFGYWCLYASVNSITNNIMAPSVFPVKLFNHWPMRHEAVISNMQLLNTFHLFIPSLHDVKLPWCKSTKNVPDYQWNVRRHQWIYHTWFFTLWPSAAILHHRIKSALVQVTACCLMALSCYLNHCWLIIVEVLWHSHEGNFKGNVLGTYP